MIDAVFNLPPIWLVGVGMTVVLLLACEVGYRLGARSRAAESEQTRSGLTTIQTALLGLLGLLLAFTYGNASGKFQDRQEAIVAEANAIGTAYLRADLAPEPHRERLRDILRRYTATRVVGDGFTIDQIAERVAASNLVLAELWPAYAELHAAGYVGPTGALLQSSINEVIDMHTTRIAFAVVRLPGYIFLILLGLSALGITLQTFIASRDDRTNRPAAYVFAVSLVLVLLLTLDMERGNDGMLRHEESPIVEMLEQMRADADQASARAGTQPLEE